LAGDPYGELKVKRDASEDDVRRAYRKLAKELHPDRNPGDKFAEERFKRATAAYSLLSDKDKRAQYDRGEIDADGNPRGPAGFQPGGGGFSGRTSGPPPEFQDLFADFFGGAAGPGFGGPKGRGGAFGGADFGLDGGGDVRAVLAVSFIEAVTGAKTRVELPGARILDIMVPAGAESGQVLRLRGQGKPGRGGRPPGDALIELQVQPHPNFRRQGDDVLLDLPISLKEAVQGAKVTAPTPTGPVALNIPAGSNSGATLRLRGRGVQRTSHAGDLLVRLSITLADPSDPDLAAFLQKWPGAAKIPQRPG
jgi:DnaJ-class molecular chaperone